MNTAPKATEWDLIEAYIVTIPSINVVTGERGPSARQVVATKERAEQIVNSGPKDKGGKPIRSYARATEQNLTAQEIAGLRRANNEAAAAASSSST